MQEANLVPEKLYPKSLFYLDLHHVAPACFIIANTALWLASGLQKEGHVKSNNVWNTEEEKATAIKRYMGLIKAIIDDFYTYDYLCKCGKSDCRHRSTKSCKQANTSQRYQ